MYLETGGVCCVDSAFAAAKVPYLIKSSEDLTKAKTALERVQMTEATSLRQAAEWGMRAVQSSMPRLKDHIAYEEEMGKRSFQPMNVNFGLFPPVEINKPADHVGRWRGKEKAFAKKLAVTSRALNDIDKWLCATST